jgi:hypothetical protein
MDDGGHRPGNEFLGLLRPVWLLLIWILFHDGRSQCADFVQRLWVIRVDQVEYVAARGLIRRQAPGVETYDFLTKVLTAE